MTYVRRPQVLVVQTAGIGNVLMILPVLRQIHDRYPEMDVDFLCYSTPAADLVAGEKLVRQIHLFNGGIRPLSLRFWKSMGKILFKYDTCLIAWRLSPLKGGILGFLSGASVRVGASERRTFHLYTYSLPLDQSLHEVEGNVNLARLAFPGLIVESPKIHLTPEELNKANETWRELNPNAHLILGVHPGCDKANAQKRWPVDRFASVSKAFLRGHEGTQVWVFFGPDELQLARSFEGIDRLVIVRPESIRGAAALIDRCSIFFNSDSGLGHIAGALGIPVLAIFGPENETIARPYGERNRVLSGDVDCRPCISRKFSKKCDHRNCLMKVSEEIVLDNLSEMWQMKMKMR